MGERLKYVTVTFVRVGVYGGGARWVEGGGCFTIMSLYRVCFKISDTGLLVSLDVSFSCCFCK
jgi:hypothetical protein